MHWSLVSVKLSRFIIASKFSTSPNEDKTLSAVPLKFLNIYAAISACHHETYDFCKYLTASKVYLWVRGL